MAEGNKISQLSIKQRIVAISGYIFVLYIAGGLITGTWIPGDGGKSLWFYSAIGLYFFTHLTSPFFVTPKDSLANSATSALLLATIDLSNIANLGVELNIFRWVSFFFAVFTTIFALSAIALYGSTHTKNPQLEAFSKISYRFSDVFGRGQLMFSLPVIISIIGFYQNSGIQQLWLFFIWLILIFIQPIDLAIYFVSQFSNVDSTKNRHVGIIQRIDSPSIIRVKLNSSDTWKRDKVHIAHLPDSRQVEVLPLFIQLQNEELIGTGFYCDATQNTIPDSTVSSVYFPENIRNVKEILKRLCGDDHPVELVGFVIEKSGISKICFEITSDLQLEQGWLVYLNHKDQKIYYQIIDAETKEESFSDNPRGTQVVFAEQMGILDADKGFKKFSWLPTMNAPIFLPKHDIDTTSEQVDEYNDLVIGFVPNSKIQIKSRFSDMLENHTAVLGATGTGKTEFTFDIIRYAITKNTKVFCVDFTSEYKTRLEDLEPKDLGLSTNESQTLDSLLLDVETAQYGNIEKGKLQNYIKQLVPKIDNRIEGFLEPEGADLGIFEVEEIANTKATLRATELYLSAIFNWARRNRKKRNILLVLEEAHTIVPEINYFGYDRVETNAVVGRMAQIALQGRKYGVGILLVSQRTALVSKTLLSQCNTVYCFKIHDETGLRYLGNVFSSDNVSTIPNLKELQAIAFGKAVYSDEPIIFEIPFDEEKKKASDALNVKT